ENISAMFGALVQGGATVLTFTLPDLSQVIPLARRLTPRVKELNDAIRETAGHTGARCVDLASYPVCGDPRLWSDDRLHANSEGHTRIAAALASALGIGLDEEWGIPYADPWNPSPAARAISDGRWGHKYLLPWVLRHAVGRSSGDGRSAKRPVLTPVLPRTVPVNR
ncbi:MAG: GDSL-type esterase/lipase family protein, partial [Gemmatimonadaceae bacterium]